MAFKAYYIPSGTKNLDSLFPGINWRNVNYYQVQAFDTGGSMIAETPNIQIVRCGEIRIHFLNYDGVYDPIDFFRPVISHETTSTSYKRGLPVILNKKDFQTERYNTSANDIFEATTSCYPQEKSEWMKECFDSPKAYIEWTGDEGQPDAYIPIVVLDGIFPTQYNEDTVFKVTLKFKLSHERIIIRN